MLTRSAPNAPPETALTSLEVQILDRIVPDKCKDTLSHKPLGNYLTKIAKLGGYLARKKDPPPGNNVMWCGLSRLTDIKLGVTLGTELMGN